MLASFWLNSNMRLAFLLLVSTLCLRGEFLRIDVSFEDIGCASCLESLEGRLRRVRGVERVEIDAAKGVAKLYLEPGNKARLAPLLSRIAQDGTKILDIRVEARGTIGSGRPGPLFQPSGLAETYRLRLPADSKAAFEPGAIYKIAGAVSEIAPAEQPVLEADSVTLDSTARE